MKKSKKPFDYGIYDINLYGLDEDGNEILNDDGTIKLFKVSHQFDLSDVVEGIPHYFIFDSERGELNGI